jgi:glycosyltransferase involved in cell wall biosynthesis
MKIVFLSFYSGEIFRGVETYVHCLSNELTKLGHDVTVYQNGPEVKGAKYNVISLEMKVDWNQKGNESKRIINILGNYWMQLVGKFTKKVLKQIDSEVDVVIPCNGNLQSIYCRIWCWLHRKPMLITGLSGPGWDDRFNVWCFPNVFIGATHVQETWAKKVNPFVKTTTIPYGANIIDFEKRVIPLKIDLPHPIILSVGALVPIKRHELEIEAVSRLKKGSLVISGKGESKEKLEKLGKEKLPGRFQIINMPHDEMPSLYHSADLFTFATSPWESFGIVLVEAMAAGLPIVASDDPIRREIVGEAGLFVDPTNADSYAKAIEKALTIDWKDKSRKQSEKFGWDTIAKEYEQLFKELVQ